VLAYLRGRRGLPLGAASSLGGIDPIGGPLRLAIHGNAPFDGLGFERMGVSSRTGRMTFGLRRGRCERLHPLRVASPPDPPECACHVRSSLSSTRCGGPCGNAAEKRRPFRQSDDEQHDRGQRGQSSGDDRSRARRPRRAAAVLLRRLGRRSHLRVDLRGSLGSPRRLQRRLGRVRVQRVLGPQRVESRRLTVPRRPRGRADAHQ
jgi:hypothetical protein